MRICTAWNCEAATFAEGGESVSVDCSLGYLLSCNGLDIDKLKNAMHSSCGPSFLLRYTNPVRTGR